jgi:branched-chain amino acid transport system substrate-binding protein
MLVPAPWREAFGQARPYKIGSLQPLTGAAASAGRSGLIGTEMAVRRINASGGVVADYQSRVDTGQRMTEKLVTDDKIDVPQGGFLSDVCLACLPLWDRHRIVNRIGACLDTRLTTSACSRYSFRPF